MQRIGAAPVLAAFSVFLLASCQPASITDANNQLRRGGARTTTFSIPLARDTFSVADLLPATDTTVTNGLIGLKFDADSLSVDLGNKLQFNGINFSQFNFSFNQMLRTSPQTISVAIAAPAPPIFGVSSMVHPVSGPAQQFTTPAGSVVSGATVTAGRLVRTINNQTGCTATGFTSSILDGTNAVVLSFPARTVTLGANTPDTILVQNIPGGVTFSNSLKVDVPAANFGVCIPTSGAAISTSVIVDTLTLSSVTLTNVNEGFTQNYSALASEPRLTAVDTIFANSGSLSLTLQNRLPINDTLTVTLNGITNGAGVVLTGKLGVGAASGSGAYQNGTLVFNLAGARIIPSQVSVQVVGVAKAAAATITTLNSTNAAIVSGTGSIVVQTLAGRLDPAQTPELTVANENADEFTKSQIDFGDFEDAIKAAHLNTANATLTIVNSARVPLVLTSFKLGVVQLDGAGNPRRIGGPGGPLDFEKDANGNQILVNIVDPGQATLTVPRAPSGTTPAQKQIVLNAATVLDSMVHKLLNNTRVALAVTGNTSVGDGAYSRITRTDFIKVRFGIAVGLDITLPPAGVTFKRKQVADGMDLSDADAADLTTRLDRATLSATISNGTPFGLTVQLSFVRDSVTLTADQITALPVCTGIPTVGCRVNPLSVVVPAGTVDAQGRVTAPGAGTISLSLAGSDVRVFFHPKFTTAIVFQMAPGAGGGGRGAIRPTDQVTVNARAQVDIKVGGG